MHLHAHGDHDHHGHAHAPAVFTGMSRGYRRALIAAIAINAAMAVIEITAGASAQSQALLADALDFVADSATYGLSLWMIGKHDAWRARAALFKGASLGLMAALILGTTLWRAVSGAAPEGQTMSLIGLLALAANVTAALLLMRWRDGDANIRSVWLCSRNDAIGNVAVMAAGLLVLATGTPWPDLIVALLLAGLFLRSALSISAQARGELRALARA
jgi:Co/Zn/Cd efflux system component